jgi:hypothetical protein
LHLLTSTARYLRHIYQALQVSVPVTVTVVVDPGSDCSVTPASITVPVTVNVGIALLVDGQKIGSGDTELKYAPCSGKPVSKWRPCAGSRLRKGGQPMKYRRPCQGKLVCVEKGNPSGFAMCMPERARAKYKRRLGWKGTIQNCRK